MIKTSRMFINLSDRRSRKEVSSAPSLGGLSSDSDRDQEEEDGADHNDSEDMATNTSSDSSHGEEDTGKLSDRADIKLTVIQHVVHLAVTACAGEELLLCSSSDLSLCLWMAAFTIPRSNNISFFLEAADQYALSYNRWLR